MSATSNSNVKAYIHAAICIGLMIGIGLLPPFGQVTQVGMKVLGIFVGMMYGWIFCGYIWPSLFGMLVYGFTGLSSVSATFNSGFGHTTVVMIIICFVFAGLVEHFRIGDALATKVFGLEFFVGKPWMMITVLILSACYISAVSNVFVIFFLYCSMMIPIFEKCGYKKGDSRVVFVIGAILFAGSLGGILFPFHMTPLMFIGFMTGAIGATVPYGQYFVWAFVIFTIALLLLIATAKFVFRLDYSAMTEDFFADKRGKKLEKDQVIGLWITVVFVVALMAPDFLPETWAVTIFLKQLGLVGVIAAIMVVCGIVRKADGTPLGDLKQFCVRGINWDVTWLLIATMPIASAMTSAECGVTATIVQFLNPVLANMSPIVFTFVLVTIIGIATQVFHNVVLGAVFIPLGSTILVGMGGNPVLMTMMFLAVVTPALGTPAGAAQSPLFHGHEWVTANAKMGYLWGWLFLVVLLIAVIAVGFPLGLLLF